MKGYSGKPSMKSGHLIQDLSVWSAGERPQDRMGGPGISIPSQEEGFDALLLGAQEIGEQRFYHLLSRPAPSMVAM